MGRGGYQSLSDIGGQEICHVAGTAPPLTGARWCAVGAGTFRDISFSRQVVTCQHIDSTVKKIHSLQVL